MIRIAIAAPKAILFRTLGSPKSLPFNLTISLTYNCNSRCRTCNIWRMKKERAELSLEEYERIFRNLGSSVFWVTLSGGEPFLRKDIVEIAKSLYKNCHPKIINIPTNGLLGEIIAEKSQQIALACPKSEIVVNLSLDGVGTKHDEIRGIPGNFDRAMTTYSHLRKINLPNLSLGVHSVISKLNHEDIPELCDFVLDELKPDSYISEVAERRVELGTTESDITPSAEDYAKAVDYIAKRTSAYKKISADKTTKTKNISRFTRAFRLGYYGFAKDALALPLGKAKQPIPCYSGFASGQISPEGDVWGCCIRAEPLGNLRENGADYELKKIWFSARADGFRTSVKKGVCSCPLANSYYTSSVCDPVSVAKVVTKLL